MADVNDSIDLYYDGECPICSNFADAVRIKEQFGDLNLVNIREIGELTKQFFDMGYDLNEGMLLKIGDRYYFAADAVHVLAMMSSRSGILNRLNYWIFRSKRMSKILYPLLKGIRVLLLKILGRGKIRSH